MGPYPRVLRHYDGLLQEASKEHEKVGWGSSASQEKRFSVLIQVGELSGASVLDVGCGLGHFWAYLRQNNIVCHYHGIDINQNMVEEAREHYPETEFSAIDLLSKEQTLDCFDYVFASGVFNLGEDNLLTRTEAMIKKMYGIAKNAVAFNLLSLKADFVEPGEVAYRPGKMLDFCLTLTRRVVLRHDYFSHDFTVYMYRDG